LPVLTACFRPLVLALCLPLLLFSPLYPSRATALGTALTTNATLTRLELPANAILDEGAAALAGALRTNRSLTHLDLAANNIRDEGGYVLGRALLANTALRRLLLASNSVGESPRADTWCGSDLRGRGGVEEERKGKYLSGGLRELEHGHLDLR